MEIIRLYRPSNGFEGMDFMERFCEQCTKDDHGQGEKVCDIIGASMVYDIDEPEYPNAWRYDGEGKPHCAQFEAERAK